MTRTCVNSRGGGFRPLAIKGLGLQEGNRQIVGYQEFPGDGLDLFGGDPAQVCNIFVHELPAEPNRFQAADLLGLGVD